MSSNPSTRRRLRLLAASVVLSTAAGAGAPAAGQDDSGDTTTTAAPTTTAPPPSSTVPDTTSSTTTTLAVPDPNDPGSIEGVGAEPVPIDPGTIPPREDPVAQSVSTGRVIRQRLDVARADAVTLGTTYAAARRRAVELEAYLDILERAVTDLAVTDRAAVRRVEAARRHFEARAATAVVRGRIDDFTPVSSGDPNELAAAHTLLGSVLESDQSALEEYLLVRAAIDVDLVRTADDLVEARNELAAAREQLVEARRANVSAQINLAIFAAGSDIVIHGFVFPVGIPHTFGDSFGAPRMMGTEFAHAHQGTDIMAPMGTPLVACERGVITKMGSDVLGGTTLWLKGESGTYYYYAHLSAFAVGLTAGQVVDGGQVVGYVGDTGNARGGSPHLHFEIHPDGGAAVNPYPLLKVVDELSRQAAAAG